MKDIKICCQRCPCVSAAALLHDAEFNSAVSEVQKQNFRLFCNFFAIADCCGTFECRQRRKSASNKLLDGPFPTFEGGRGSAIAKKLQKEQDFCFQNERIATTGRVLQPAALKQEACRSRQCRGEGGAAAGSAATRGLPQRGYFCSL